MSISDRKSTKTKSLGVSMGILVAGFLTLGAQGARASLTPGWTPQLTIQNIIVESDGAILTIEGGIPAAYLRDDCNSSPYNFIDLSTPVGRSQLATALIAHTSGRQILLALQACNAGRPAITHIRL
jgi:hypothetical protein